MKFLLFIPLSILTIFTSLSAQNGGRYSFAFLRQSPSARLTGLMQSQIALRDDDLAIAAANPAMLNPLMHNGLSFNYNFLLAGIGNADVFYGRHSERLKTTFSIGFQNINYGKFKQTDEFGNVTGEFKASEIAATIGAARQINERLSVGINLKFISSQLESYKSNGIAADLAGAYVNAEKNFGATIVLKNVGAQLSTYNGTRDNLPTDVQIGFSKKLSRAPFRFSVVAHDLLRWNLRYDNPLENETSLLGDTPTAQSPFVLQIDNIFRHLNFGAELAFGKKENFRIRAGYSHQTRREMNILNVRSLAGFAFGFGFKVNRFRIDYGLNPQSVAGGTNHLSLSTNLSEFMR